MNQFFVLEQRGTTWVLNKAHVDLKVYSDGTGVLYVLGDHEIVLGKEQVTEVVQELLDLVKVA